MAVTLKQGEVMSLGEMILHEFKNNKEFADTFFKREIGNRQYDVGDVLETKKANITLEDIVKRFGGTWEEIPAGYATAQAGTVTLEDGTTKTFSVGDTYGEFMHKLTVDEMPSHSHQAVGYDINSADGSEADRNTFQATWTTKADFYISKINNTGDDKYHNNMQPVIFTRKFVRLSLYEG